MSKSLTAVVTAVYVIPDICTEEDLEPTPDGDPGSSFEDMVRHLIQAEGLAGLDADDPIIVKVERQE